MFELTLTTRLHVTAGQKSHLARCARLIGYPDEDAFIRDWIDSCCDYLLRNLSDLEKRAQKGEPFGPGECE